MTKQYTGTMKNYDLMKDVYNTYPDLFAEEFLNMSLKVYQKVFLRILFKGKSSKLYVFINKMNIR